MSVSLRLSRGGTKKRPFYRIVAADIRSPRDGRFIERLGTYNPMKDKNSNDRVVFNEERIKYWLSVGAKPTNRVAKFLSTKNLVEKPKVYEQTKKNKPSKKTLERIKAKEEKIKKQETEKDQLSAAGETPKPVATAETPKPEVAAETPKPEAAPETPKPQVAPETPKPEASAETPKS